MKFVCDQCRTKYSIGDDRVRGKQLKIRCKQCNFVITVRDTTVTSPSPPKIPADARASGSTMERALDDSFGPRSTREAERTVVTANPSAMLAAMAPPSAAADEWFVSFDGDQEGPFSLEAAVERVRVETQSGKEAHAWRDGFDGWLPVSDVPEFARLLPSRSAAPKVATPVIKSGPRLTGAQGTVSSTRPQTGSVKTARPATGSMKIAASASSGPLRMQDSQPTMMDPSALSEPLAMPGSGKMAAAAQMAPALPDLRPSKDPTPPPIPGLSASASSLGLGISGVPDEPLPVSNSGPDLLIDNSVVKPIPMAPVNGHAPGPAPQVVVVAGAAPSRTPWRMAILAAGAVIVVLVTMIVYLWRKPGVERVVMVEGHPIVEGQVNVVGGGPNAPLALPTAKSSPSIKHSSSSSSSSKNAPSTKPQGPALTAEQQAALARFSDGRELNIKGPDTTQRKSANVAQADIMGVISRNKQSLKLCYDRVLKHDTSLKNARLDVTANVGMSGSVTKVEIPDGYSSSEIGKCIAAAVKKWHFPSQDGEYPVQFPIILTAQ